METTKGHYIFGTVKVGERGQIIIPKEARQVFDIKAGDTLIVLGDEKWGIAVTKADVLEKHAYDVFKKSRRDRRMQTSNTALFFLEDDCIRAFGQETGCTLLQQAEELYQDLCQHGNDRGNHVIKEHLQSRLLPLMSYYKALLKHGIQEDQALLLVRETAHKAAIDKKPKCKN